MCSCVSMDSRSHVINTALAFRAAFRLLLHWEDEDCWKLSERQERVKEVPQVLKCPHKQHLFLRWAQSWLGPGFLQEPHSTWLSLSAGASVCTSPASDQFKKCFKPTLGQWNRWGMGLAVDISPQVLCTGVDGRGDRPHVCPTQGKRQKITCTESPRQEDLLMLHPLMSARVCALLYDTRECNIKAQIQASQLSPPLCSTPEAEL